MGAILSDVDPKRGLAPVGAGHKTARPWNPGPLFRSIGFVLVMLGAPGTAFAEASAAEGPAGRHSSAEIIPLAAWQDPPPEARPVARWWWPGGSVEPEGLRQQLASIKSAGFGGVELQPLLLGLGDADLAADPNLRSVGKPGFHSRVAQAAAMAKGNGLAFDLTLGSGWPGGLPTPPKNAERQLLMAEFDLQGPSAFVGSLPPPPDQSYRSSVEWVLDVLGPADPAVELVAVLAARVGPERDGVATLGDAREITENVQSGRLEWAVPPGEWRVLVFYTNSTEHFVMGGAFPGEETDARVVDHLSRSGADALLDGYGVPAVDSLPSDQVRGVFVDSFELMGELPFTADFQSSFEHLAGYDVTPHLPLLFRVGGESKYGEMVDFLGRTGGPVYLSSEPGRSKRIREDYERVRRILFEEKFVDRFVQWARARGLEFRLQAHGGYGDYLDTYALADVPESEGLFGGGSFDFLKLAASAAHVADRRWASSESFITLRLFGTRLSKEEMRLLAGRAYSAGINRLVFHGVPYPYRRADGETWYPFSGGFGRILAGPFPMSSQFDASFLEELPEFNRHLGRLSVAMSQGQPDAEIAWLRSDPSYPDAASLQLGSVEPQAGESPTTRALRARGLVHDRISRRMLSQARLGENRFKVGARTYRALMIDPLPVAEPALVERVAHLAESGIPVFALGELPHRAPGLRDAKARDERVRAATKKLEPLVLRAGEGKEMETLLSQHVTGSLVEPVPGEKLTLSLERRRSEGGDVLLLFNESWSPTSTHLRFTQNGRDLTRWHPRSGKRQKLRETITAGDVVPVELEAAESLVWTLGRDE